MPLVACLVARLVVIYYVIICGCCIVTATTDDTNPNDYARITSRVNDRLRSHWTVNDNN